MSIYALPKTVELSAAVVLLWESSTWRELKASSLRDWEMSSSTSMSPMSSPYRGLSRIGSPSGDEGLYRLGMSTMALDHGKLWIIHQSAKTKQWQEKWRWSTENVLYLFFKDCKTQYPDYTGFNGHTCKKQWKNIFLQFAQIKATNNGIVFFFCTIFF